jgi:hypothetical protein
VEAVRLSDLKEQFQYQFEGVRSRLYQDAVQRQWFTDQPDMVRRRWVVRGQALTVVGAALLGLLLWLTHFGLAAIPILLAGPVLIVGARWMPFRTPVGAGLLRRVTGFRAYLETAGADRAGSAQAADQFSPYPPYAIVFGLSEQWTRTFELVGAPPRLLGTRVGTRAASPPHRIGSHPASTSSRRRQRRPSARRPRRSEESAGLVGATFGAAAAPRATAEAASQAGVAAAPRAAVAAEAAAAPGESESTHGTPDALRRWSQP